MASPNIYPNGAGGVLGPTLATGSPIYTSGVFWYVSSQTGVDAGGPRGQERERPLATLSQAYSNASAGDTIVFLENHAESIPTQITMAKNGLHMVGEGSGDSRPAFTCSGAIAMLYVDSAGVQFRNLRFPQSTDTATTRLQLNGSAAATLIDGCSFESGALDTNTFGALRVHITTSLRIVNTTFISVATSLAGQPAAGMSINSTIADLEMDNVTFDGGDYGWSTYAFNAASAITRLKATNIHLLNSDMLFVTGTGGHMHPGARSGSSRVVWTA